MNTGRVFTIQINDACISKTGEIKKISSGRLYTGRGKTAVIDRDEVENKSYRLLGMLLAQSEPERISRRYI